MSRIEFAQKAVILHQGRVLLVRKSKDDPYNPGCWELPGGRLDGGEDLDQHIKREVLEETGLSVEPGRLIDLWSWEMAWKGEPVRVVAVSRHCAVHHTNGVEPSREPDDFLDEQAWWPVAQLADLDIIETQRSTIKSITER